MLNNYKKSGNKINWRSNPKKQMFLWLCCAKYIFIQLST